MKTLFIYKDKKILRKVVLDRSFHGFGKSGKVDTAKVADLCFTYEPEYTSYSLT